MRGFNVSVLPGVVVSSRREPAGALGHAPILDNLRQVFQHAPSVHWVLDANGVRVARVVDDAVMLKIAGTLTRSGSLEPTDDPQEYVVQWDVTDYQRVDPAEHQKLDSVIRAKAATGQGKRRERHRGAH